MNLLFILISILILLVFIIVAAKPIIAGIKAKSVLIEDKERRERKIKNLSPITNYKPI